MADQPTSARSTTSTPEPPLVVRSGPWSRPWTTPQTPRAWGRPAPAVAVGLGVALGLELVRVWLPSVVFIHGRAGSTPATEMGAFALGLVAGAVLLAAVLAWLGVRRVALAALVVVLVARVALQGGPGGGLQLAAASAGVVAWTVWLGMLTAGALPRRAVAGGLGLGFVLDLTLRGVLATAEPVWTAGAGGWLVGLGLAAAALWSWRAVPVRGGKPADRPGRGAPDGRAATWLVLGPVLLLWGVVGGLPSRLVAVDGIGVTSAVGLHVLLAAVLLPVMLWSARRRPGVAAAGATAGAVLVAATGTDGALVPAAVTLVGVLLLLGGVLGAVTASTAADPARQAGRGRAAATGAGAVLLFAVLGFVVYAAYDIDLGISGDALLRIACLLCLPALLPLVRGPVVDLTVLEAPAGAVRGLVAAATALALLTSAGAALSSRPQAPPPSGGEAAGAPAVRVLLYNVHMGFDTRGRFVPATLADVIRAELPDVVVLNEIDRGWMLDGGHDLLGLLASRVGLPHVAFAPAADEVWGNAVLSRYPISSQAWAPLPLGGVPMRRSAMELTLETPHGPVAIVATHLHHLEDEPEVRLEQARSVAAFVGTRLPGPVVVAGDLNAVPGAPELAPLEALVTDLTGTDAATYPSWDPQRRIDHVLGSPGLAGVDASVPASEASDHLGVAVTVLLP